MKSSWAWATLSDGRMRLLIPTTLLLVSAVLTGCYTKRTRVNEPVTGEASAGIVRRSSHVMTHEMQSRPVKMFPEQSAEEFLRTRLKDSGLPGLPRNVDGTFETNLRMQPESGQAPSTCTVRFMRTGDPSPYVYWVEPTEGTPAWRITRALQADANGRILKEFKLE